MNTVEPIRDLGKIEVMKKLLRGQSTRDWLLFCLGINSAVKPTRVRVDCPGKGMKEVFVMAWLRRNIEFVLQAVVLAGIIVLLALRLLGR